MKKDLLNEYLGKNVTLKFFDGDIVQGELHQTDEEMFQNNKSIYGRPGFYCCLKEGTVSNCIFRSSHVSKIIRKR